MLGRAWSRERSGASMNTTSPDAAVAQITAAQPSRSAAAWADGWGSSTDVAKAGAVVHPAPPACVLPTSAHRAMPSRGRSVAPGARLMALTGLSYLITCRCGHHRLGTMAKQAHHEEAQSIISGL